MMHVMATTACHDRLVGEGIDLSAFNTSENSADFADLRKALHIKEWNVVRVVLRNRCRTEPDAGSSDRGSAV